MPTRQQLVDGLEKLAITMANAGAKITNMRFNACRKCLDGDMKPNGTASWQNRWTCNKCGDHESKRRERR